MITDLKDMMEERLLAYRAKNRDLPQRILVYRDGVSEVCDDISSIHSA
jgi:eukaryotic translation initiation factor 2C